MKQGWEYKKLDTCCEVEYGTRVVQKKDGGTIYPVYGGGGETFRMDRYNREDSIVVSRFAMSKTCVRFVRGKFFLNDSGLSVKAGVGILQEYLNHHLFFLNDSIYNLGKGAAQRNLEVKAFKQLLIAIPPLSEQQSIVAELDKINEIIELKKEQLKDLDLLAQSIFYDMFGDPIENPKGWEVVPFNSVGEFGRGVSKNRPRNAPELLGGTMPLIQTGDVTNSGMYITSYEQTYSELGVSQSKVWQSGTICITIAANIGNCSILTFEACFPDSVVGFVSNGKVKNEYSYFVLCSLQEMLEHNAPGAAQKNINLKVLNSLLIPLPPLSLQQSFVEKIQAIESQKSAIKQSLAEVETLLASRMDYWFG